MNTLTLFKVLFNEFPSFKSDNLDIQDEIRGFLDSPKLCDYILKGFEENCISKIEEYHSKAKILKISVLDSEIKFKIKNYNEKKDKEFIFSKNKNSYCSDTGKIIADKIQNLMKELNTKFIIFLKFSNGALDEWEDILPDFVHQAFPREKFDFFICRIEENDTYHKLYLNEKEDNHYVQYFYKHTDGQFYCAYMQTNINYINNGYFSVARYFEAREERIFNKNEVKNFIDKNLYKNNMHEKDIVEIIKKSIDSDKLTEFLKVNFKTKILEKNYDFCWDILKKTQDFFPVYQSFLTTSKGDTWKLHAIIFQRDCFCDQKCYCDVYKLNEASKFFNKLFLSYYKDTVHGSLNVRQSCIETIFDHIIRKHFDLIQSKLLESYSYYFLLDIANDLIAYINKLKVIIRFSIMAYNVKKLEFDNKYREEIVKNASCILAENQKIQINEIYNQENGVIQEFLKETRKLTEKTHESPNIFTLGLS